jgi:tRNA (guanine37-N1)-methyltransferase
MSAPADMFAPPVNRAMKALDRSFFQKTVPTAAARIFNAKDISRCRNDLDRSHDTLKHRIAAVRSDPDTARAEKGGKCLLLRPEIVPSGMTHPLAPTHIEKY